MPERDIGGDVRLFVHGQCSVCGGKASRRMHGEDWFHVSIYDDFTIRRAVQCPEGGGGYFVQKPSTKGSIKTPSVEPHYREVERETWDYDHVNEQTGQPEPILRKFMQPVLCTCTSPSCPGQGKPMPEDIRKFREQEDVLALGRKRHAGPT